MLSGPEQAALPGRLNPIYLEGRPLQLETPIAQQLGLRDGQVVQASVELRGEALKLLLNGKLFDLPAALRFRPGETVFLRAYQGANGWLLKIFDPTAQPQPRQRLHPRRLPNRPRPRSMPRGWRPCRCARRCHRPCWICLRRVSQQHCSKPPPTLSLRRCFSACSCPCADFLRPACRPPFLARVFGWRRCSRVANRRLPPTPRPGCDA